MEHITEINIHASKFMVKCHVTIAIRNIQCISAAITRKR